MNFPYSVQSTKGHVDGQREQVLDHFLKSFHELLFVSLDLFWFEAQEDPHGYAEHQSLHLWIDQHAGVLVQPLLHCNPHLLLNDGNVELQRLPGEGPHDCLEKQRRRLAFKPKSPSIICLNFNLKDGMEKITVIIRGKKKSYLLQILQM